eukprot:16469-Pelagococcus_subviridis.AAC.2
MSRGGSRETKFARRDQPQPQQFAGTAAAAAGRSPVTPVKRRAEGHSDAHRSRLRYVPLRFASARAKP